MKDDYVMPPCDVEEDADTAPDSGTEIAHAFRDLEVSFNRVLCMAGPYETLILLRGFIEHIQERFRDV